MAAQEDLDFALSVFQSGTTFFLFPYCGYMYNYAPSRRVVPIKDLLGNQQKLFCLAEQSNAGEKYLLEAANKIRDLTYVGLFHCKSVKEIIAIANIPNIKQDIRKKYIASGEKNLVLKLFLAGKNKRIFLYFYLRNGVKRLLRKNNP